MSTVHKRLTSAGSPFELTTRVQREVPQRIYTHAPATLREVFERARPHSHRVFMVSDVGATTYGQALALAGALSRGLRQRFGIAPGSRVALLMSNRQEWALSFLALANLGAVPVLLDNARSYEDMDSAMELAGCCLIIADGECALMLTAAGEQRPVVRAPDELFGLLKPEERESVTPARQLDPHEAALIAFTSGTTARPKGAVFSHQSVITGLMNMLLGGALIASKRNRGGLTTVGRKSAQPVCLVVSPLFHIGGYAQLLLMPLIGGKLVLLKRWDARAASLLINHETISSLTGATPPMVRELLALHRAGSDLSSLSRFNIHGSALQQNLVQDIVSVLPDAAVCTGYGMTETSGSICVACDVDFPERPETCGQPIPSVDLKLLNEHGKEVALGETGEIWIRGACLMQGYCGLAEATSEVLRGGWFRTGDLGRLDADGFLFVIDRIKDSKVIHGRYLACSDIERTLALHPLVEEAAACVPDETARLKQILVAVVLKREGAVTRSAIARFLAERTPAVTNLRMRVAFCNRLPRNASGKVDKHQVTKFCATHSSR